MARRSNEIVDGDTEIALRHLGGSSQAAVRRIIGEFVNRSWRDDGEAALSMVRSLEAAGGSGTIRRVASAVPASFLAVNGISRRDIQDLLERLTGPA